MTEAVNHPQHYAGPPCDHCGKLIECITIIRHKSLNIGNAQKYIWRQGKKGSAVEDMNKAIFYLCDEIRLQGGEVSEKLLTEILERQKAARGPKPGSVVRVGGDTP